MTKVEAFVGQSGATWRYWPERPLGAPGGFGGVCAAEAADGIPMAVKVVKKARPSGVLDERLLRREVEIGRRVADGGGELLLPVIDVAEVDGKLLLVMVRADGALADQSLPLDEYAAIAVMMDIVSGLQELHSIGIIHRDLKPANVLAHGGRWKLADFGIARDEEIGTQNPTFVGWGSPPYMAPELWAGKSPTVKTDLYAFGCLAFELLSGTTPYTGDGPALRQAHLSQNIPDAPTANTVLRNLVARLLAKDPGERPQDARAAIERLQRVRVPRTPLQDAIARGLGDHLAEKSLRAAGRAAGAAGAEARRQQIAQAHADLEEIIRDSLEDLRSIEPDAELRDEPGRLLTLHTADAWLRLDLWEHAVYVPAPEDTMVLAGSCIIANRRTSGELHAANLVYEKVFDRLVWQMYRFRDDPSGPHNRAHGLRRGDFLNRQARQEMLESLGRAWRMTATPLTSNVLLELFREAVDLKPADLHIGF